MIPITKPSFGREEGEAARAAVESGWVSQGPKVAEFERAVASYCGAEHAVAVSNCTTALHLAMVVLDVGPGDEVICPSMSFIATANAIRYTGAMPVFADVDPRTYNLDPDSTAALITARTKAILVVHQIGMPADLDGFYRLAKDRNLAIIEDAACAIGSRYRGVPIGGRGDLVCFSFHPRKVITTGEGGMLLTGRADYAERLRLLRQHGMNVSDVARHASRRVTIESYECLGFNYRMTDIQAAVGIEQMKRLEWIVSRRRELAARYSEQLNDHPWLAPPHVPAGCDSNYQSYAVQLRAGSPISRDELMQRLLDRGIATRRGIMLSHREPAYARFEHGPLPASESASDNSLLLPLFPDLSEAEQLTVIEALDEVFAETRSTTCA